MELTPFFTLRQPEDKDPQKTLHHQHPYTDNPFYPSTHSPRPYDHSNWYWHTCAQTNN